jgi:hypothetical protein
MITAPRLNLPGVVADCRPLLEQNLLNGEAARQMREALGEHRPADPALAALWEVCAVLYGGSRWRPADVPERPLPILEPPIHDALVLHPRESQQRQHLVASWGARMLLLLDRSDMARGIARVTEKAIPQTHPQLTHLTGECSRALQVPEPDIHVARGTERLFAPFTDKTPFLCIHQDYLSEPAGGNGRQAAHYLSPPEMRFALAHQMEHIRGKHVALLQLSPEQMEGMLMDLVAPKLLQTPIRLAKSAWSWAQVNTVVKKVADKLPGKSITQRAVAKVEEYLPDEDRETILPETAHAWVRGWIQGVEYSADRAGLFVSDSVAASCAALLRVSPEYGLQVPDILQHGASWLLQENANADRGAADRLRELLTFAVSEPYLRFVRDGCV